MKIKHIVAAVTAASLVVSVGFSANKVQQHQANSRRVASNPALSDAMLGNSWHFMHNQIAKSGMWMGANALTTISFSNNYLLGSPSPESFNVTAGKETKSYALALPYMNVAFGYQKNRLGFTTVLGYANTATQDSTGAIKSNNNSSVKINEAYVTYVITPNVFAKVGKFNSPLGSYDASSPLQPAGDILREQSVNGMQAGYAGHDFSASIAAVLGAGQSNNQSRPDFVILNAAYALSKQYGIDFGYSSTENNNATTVPPVWSVQGYYNLNDHAVIKLGALSQRGTVSNANLYDASFGMQVTPQFAAKLYGEYASNAAMMIDLSSSTSALMMNRYTIGAMGAYSVDRNVTLAMYVQGGMPFKANTDRKTNISALLAAGVHV